MKMRFMLHRHSSDITRSNGSPGHGRKLEHSLQFLIFLSSIAYAWPLLLKLPHSLRVLFNTFRPGGLGIPDKNFWAFSPADAGFRTWYTKITKDYTSQGRFGYVWDDGLGMPLGARIYNNMVTYWLLQRLGTRHMLALGLVFMVLMSAAVAAWKFNTAVGALIGLVVMGSPLIVGAYTHLGKPEVFWWGITFPIVILAFTGNTFMAGLVWSFLACSNLSISVMLVLLLGPSLLFLLPTSALLFLLLGALPGILKHGIRGIYMLRTGFLTTLINEQSRLWKRPWHPTAGDLLWWVPFGLSIGTSAYALHQPLVGGMLLISGIGLYWINFRVIYLNDPQSFHLLFYVIALCYAAMAQSFLGLLFILVLTYIQPVFCGFPLVENQCSRHTVPWKRHMCRVKAQMGQYPILRPMEVPKPISLMAFLDAIPRGARILFESDGDPRTESKFRAFWQWTEEFLPDRQIDLANEIYTKTVEANLADLYLNRFNASTMPSEEMEALCNVLGVSYVVAHSQLTIEAMEGIGFACLARVDLGTLDGFCEIIPTPQVTLSLLKNPKRVTVVEPAVAWKRNANELTWDAKAHQTYLVRYRYNPLFRGRQNGFVLPVEPVKPIGNIPLQFMQVTAAVDGQLALKFHSRWI